MDLLCLKLAACVLLVIQLALVACGFGFVNTGDVALGVFTIAINAGFMPVNIKTILS